MTVMVTMRHVRALKLCASGARRFCQQHNIDWYALRREGIPAEVLEATGNPFALAAVKEARRGQQ